MKKIIFLLYILLVSTLFAAGPIDIELNDSRLSVELHLNEGEHIAFSEDFVYIFVESDEYDFIFAGYPEGELQDNGLVYYSGSMILEGDLILKEGVAKGNYDIEVTIGYQTCTDDGVCHMPVEKTVVFSVKNSNTLIYIGMGLLLIVLVFSIVKLKRKNA